VKKIWGIAILCLPIFLLAGCSKAAQTGTTTGITAKQLRVATQPGPQMAPIFVAKEMGWLQNDLAKDGVTVQWSSFLSGPPMNEAFAAGQLDIGFLGDTAAIIPKSAGQNLRIISSVVTAPTALAIVVPKDSPITSPSELRGKKVATVKGSYGHHLLALVLQNNGLTTNDIQFINMPQGDAAAALANHDIDAASIWEPVLSQVLNNGTARELVNGTGIKQGLLVIVADDNFAKQNPALVQIFLKDYQRGIDYIKSNPQDAAKLIASDIKMQPAQYLKILNEFNYEVGIHPSDIAELQKSETFMLSAGLIRTPVDIDTYVDSSYADNAGLK
jgi:sulfonate transport system substrate-binding protein